MAGSGLGDRYGPDQRRPRHDPQQGPAEIHGKRADTVAAWSNPRSGNSGTITLLKKFTQARLACEQIEYRFKSSRPQARPERYLFNSCLQPDGTWKLAP